MRYYGIPTVGFEAIIVSNIKLFQKFKFGMSDSRIEIWGVSERILFI